METEVPMKGPLYIGFSVYTIVCLRCGMEAAVPTKEPLYIELFLYTRFKLPQVWQSDSGSDGGVPLCRFKQG